MHEKSQGLEILYNSLLRTFEPLIDWHNSLPPTVRRAMKRKQGELRKGKRHRPSRYR